MSINSILSSATSGLNAAQAGLRTTANNVSNVNTPGYARQKVGLESIVAGGSTAGVTVSEISRVADRFLELSAISASSDAARFETLQRFNDRFQGLLGRSDSETGIASRLDKAFQSLATMALDPSDAVRRQGAIADLDRFAADVARLGNDVQQLRADASNQIQEAVGSVNQILERIHELNPLIVKEKVTGSNVGALEEQRAQAVRELSQFLDIQTNMQPNGAMQVSTRQGLALVDGSPRQLSYAAPGTVGPSTNFPAITVVRTDPNTGRETVERRTLDQAIGGGRLKGLLELRDDDLPRIADNIGELARVFADEINKVHNENTAFPPPSVFEGTQTGVLGTDRHAFQGIAHFSVVNDSGAIIRKVTMDFSSRPVGEDFDTLIGAINAGFAGFGTVSLTDGQLRFQSNIPDSGVVVAQDETAPSTRNGRGFSHFFGLNDLIQTGAPTSKQTGLIGPDPHGFTVGSTVGLALRDPSNGTLQRFDLTMPAGNMAAVLGDLNTPGAFGNFGTFTLASGGELVFTPNAGFEDTEIRVLSDSTNRGSTGVSFSNFFGLNHGTLAQTADGYRVSEDIRNDPNRLAVSRPDPNALVGEIIAGPGDQTGALALQSVELAAFNFSRAGGLDEMQTTASQYLAFVISESALEAERVRLAAEDSRALEVDVTQRRDDYSGVNLDEELSQMVIYQNAYNASARMLTAAREVYDALLQAV
ncbi:MAG: flagellar hook-associated protein FlgK [Pseudomonadota bacterium]